MTCPKCGYCEACGRSTASQFARWQCALCGVWVTYGSVHSCITSPGISGPNTAGNPYPAYPTFTSSFPSETLP